MFQTFLPGLALCLHVATLAALTLNAEKARHFHLWSMHSSKPAGLDLARLHAELETWDSNNVFNLSSHSHPPSSKHLPTFTTSLLCNDGEWSNHNEILWKNIKRGEFCLKTTGFNKARKPLKMSSVSERARSHARGTPWPHNVIQWARNAVFHRIVSNGNTSIQQGVVITCG